MASRGWGAGEDGACMTQRLEQLLGKREEKYDWILILGGGTESIVCPRSNQIVYHCQSLFHFNSFVYVCIHVSLFCSTNIPVLLSLVHSTSIFMPVPIPFHQGLFVSIPPIVYACLHSIPLAFYSLYPFHSTSILLSVSIPFH